MRGLLVASLFIAAPMTALGLSVSARATTLLEAAHLLDPRTGRELSPAAVLIEGDKIVDVGRPAKFAAQTSSRRWVWLSIPAMGGSAWRLRCCLRPAALSPPALLPGPTPRCSALQNAQHGCPRFDARLSWPGDVFYETEAR